MKDEVIYCPPLKAWISFSTVISRMNGTKVNRKTLGAVMMEQREIFLQQANRMRNSEIPRRKSTGEMKRMYPAIHETAFPPLK